MLISRNGHPAALAIGGDIDEHSYPGLVTALQAVGERQREVHVDLVNLTYCDLDGLRAVPGLTGAASAEDPVARLVVLQKVPLPLRKIMQILGWDATPRLVIGEVAATADWCSCAA